MEKIYILIIGILIGAIPTGFLTASIYSDVSAEDWYYMTIIDLKEKGIIENYQGGSYDSESNISRAELAMIIDSLMEVTRAGCVYADRFYFDDDVISRTDALEYSCQNGKVEKIMWDEF